jgi:CRP/FNR family transcriptional regulator
MKKTAVQASELLSLKTLDWIPSDRMDLLGRHLTELRISKGEMLYHPGRTARHLYCVLEGAVGLSLAGSAGHLLHLSIATRGEFFGVSAFVPGWSRVSQAVALRDSRVGRIEARTFVTEVCGLPWDVFTAVIESTLKPLLQVSLRRALFLIENLVDRVALLLWEYASHPIAKETMGLLPPALTHEELAALVGASRPRVSLALRELERKGLFTREANQIRVHEKRLRGYLEDKYGYLF